MGLTNEQLHTFALNNAITNEHFKGAYSQNALPCPLAFAKYRTAFIIVNTADIFKLENGHWTLVFKDEESIIYFCPLCTEPKANLQNFLMATGSYITNARQVQARNSSICGEFCMYFALMRLLGYTNNEVLHTFAKDNLECNDTLVLEVFQEHFTT